MVSTLSSRLLSARDSKSLDNSVKGKIDSQSGYTADEEKKPTLPPVLIDFHKKYRAFGLSHKSDNKLAKRSKLSEINYAAASVKKDLSKAGRTYPLQVTNRSRILPNLDVSRVQVVSSKSLESSPFLLSRSDELPKSKYETLMYSYQRFLSDTACFFNKEYETLEEDSDEQEASEGISEEVESSIISSLSDNDSDGCNESEKYEDSAEIKGKSVSKASHCLPAYLSMGEALVARNSPRIIASATPPYEIVSVNAVYASLTGFSLLEALGKPLFQLMTPASPKDSASLEEIVKLPKENRDSVSFSIRCLGKLQKSLKCRTSIIPVASSSMGEKPKDNAANRKITHYSIDLKPEENDEQGIASTTEIQLQESSMAVTSMSVVG